MRIFFIILFFMIFFYSSLFLAQTRSHLRSKKIPGQETPHETIVKQISEFLSDGDKKEEEITHEILTEFAHMARCLINIIKDPKDAKNVAKNLGNIVSHMGYILNSAIKRSSNLIPQELLSLEDELYILNALSAYKK